MNVMLGLFNLGGMEVVLIFAVILLLFGAKKLPELARGLGQGIKEFKKATTDVSQEFNRAMEEPPKTLPPASSSAEMAPQTNQTHENQPPPTPKVV